jgi:flagellar protein FliS
MLAQDAYLESQIQTADPLELVRLLYRAAGGATRSATAHLAAGRIAERARQISKAHAILTQLTVTLDHARGGALSRSLAELYDYMQRRLLEANQRRKAEPLVEVERLLTTLLEGWDQIAPEPAARQIDAISPMDAESQEYGGYHPAFAPAAAADYASQSCSF